MLISVSEVLRFGRFGSTINVFYTFACSVGTTKYCQWKRKLQFYSWESCDKYTGSTDAKCVQFLLDNTSFRKLNYLKLQVTPYSFLQHTDVKIEKLSENGCHFSNKNFYFCKHLILGTNVTSGILSTKHGFTINHNPVWKWILRFLWRTMIRKILDWSV